VSEKDLERAVEAMLRDRRPAKGSLTRDEAGALKAAARLRAAHPGASNPSPEFVDDLARQLREQPAGASRRRFLRGAGIAAAAAVAGIVGDRVVATVTEATRATPGHGPELVPLAASWTRVTTLAALQEKPVVRFTAGSVTGFVISNGGQIVAMSAVCTHQGCILDAAADSRSLLCPCHEQSFGLDGAARNSSYYLAPLPRLRSRVSGADVEVFV